MILLLLAAFALLTLAVRTGPSRTAIVLAFTGCGGLGLSNASIVAVLAVAGSAVIVGLVLRMTLGRGRMGGWA